MASQLYGVTGNVKRRPTYVDQINAERSFLPQIISNKAQNKALEAKQALDEKSYGLAERQLVLGEQSNAQKEREISEMARGNQANAQYNQASINLANRNLAYQKDASGRTAGLEMLKLATNLSMGPLASRGVNPTTAGGTTTQQIGNWAAPAVGGALAGWGASKMFGGGNTFKKALFGTGAGLLSGFLGGNWGSNMNWGSTLSSGLGGLVGGMFG